MILKTTGTIAPSLERSFLRVIEIMSSLKNNWYCLSAYRYQLSSFNEQFKVKDARSADLSFCLAALNIIRNEQQKKIIEHYVGSGSLRIDGSLNQTFLELNKELAVIKETKGAKKFINSQQCAHIFALEALLENYSTEGERHENKKHHIGIVAGRRCCNSTG